MESTNAEGLAGSAGPSDEITEEEFDQLLADLASESPAPSAEAAAPAAQDMQSSEVELPTEEPPAEAPAAEPADVPVLQATDEAEEPAPEESAPEESAEAAEDTDTSPEQASSSSSVDDAQVPPAPIVVVLEEAPGIATVGTLYGELGEVKDSAEAVTVDLSKVRCIDVAALQCLYGFVAHRSDAGLRTDFAEPSPAFTQAASRLGLAKALPLEEVAQT